MPKAPRVKVGQSKKVVHPNSRRAKEICRRAFRDQRLEKNKTLATSKLELLAEKLLWFQDNIDEDRKDFTKNDLIECTEQYMGRFEDELEQIMIVKSVGSRHGHQHASRESAIKLTLEMEKNEFEGTGIEVPDIINGNNLNYFKKWEGEFRYISNIKLRKISSRDVVNMADDDKNVQDNDD